MSIDWTWPLGGEERHFDAFDFYECVREFRRAIEPEGFRVLCQGAFSLRPLAQSAALGLGEAQGKPFGSHADHGIRTSLKGKANPPGPL
jgi:hypothetical protein